MKRTLFIGLGGCGLKTVSKLSQKLASNDDPNVEYLYFYVDTDEETRAAINADGDIIPLSQFLNVGDTNPYRVYQQSTRGDSPRDNRALEWMISQGSGHLTFPNQQLSDGAQADRMVGRTALVQHADDFKSSIEKLLNVFSEHKANDGRVVEADIWVVSSCCGGTGSSISIDTLYLINRIANEKQMDASVKLVLYMPKPFIDVNTGLHNYPLNGYAYMWELNTLKQGILDGGNDIFTHFSAYPWGYKDDEKYDLFKMVIPVDVETDRNTKIPLEDLYPTTAEMMYYLVVGKGAQTIVGNLSNSLRDSRRDSSKLERHSDTPFLWGTWMVPYGYHVIRKANPEFREYMKKRATLEILRYGLLGEEIENDDDVRETAKKEFAAKYILPFLCDVDNVSASEDESVQAELNEAFRNIRLPIDGLDSQRIKGFINNISNNIEESRSIKNTYYDKICSSINLGISSEIAKHGVKYVWTLLQLVDDYYLEKLNAGSLLTMLRDAENDAETCLVKLNSFASQGINKKNASAAADTGKKYAEACKLVTTFRIVRDIIVSLTEQYVGYLEVIRNGDADRIGLMQLMNLLNMRVSIAQRDWELLSKKFLDSKNDALTVYIPSLSEIAGENGNGWAKDSIFEDLYYSSILPYDKELAKGVNGRRIPAHKQEGSTIGIDTYLNQLVSQFGQDVFVQLAMATPAVAKTRLDDLITKQLSEILDGAIDTQGTAASKWLNQSLEDYISDNKDSIKMETLTNPALIPLLYPMKTVHSDPVTTGLVYVGASKSLAETFGYQDNTNNCEYVEDKRMTDRFQIMKMPVGLDFYSYKYFNQIQDSYYAARESILAEREGCHIHKAFRFLDMNKALSVVKTPQALDSLRLFFKNKFLQQVVNLLKEKDIAAFQSLMGQLDFFTTMNQVGTAGNENNATDDFLSAIGLGGGSKTDSGIIDMGEASVDYTFFEERIERENNSATLVITIHPCRLGTDNHLIIDSSPLEYRLPGITTPKLFAEALMKSDLSGLSLLSQLKKVELVEKALSVSAVKDAFNRVKAEAQREVLRKGDINNDPTFGIILNAWFNMRHNSDDEFYMNEIRQYIKNLIQ